ncbi:MAG: hypothetical protein K9L17_05900 [Clostridiales bacterium]|nr:hypothetical protein [Clostridiales bacterium]MCF8022205.1 hypothetical protein [Clostridiales bacterium]
MTRPTCYSGPAGSGKTTGLVEYYKKLVNREVKSSRILVLVMNRTQINKWRSELQFEKNGPIYIMTFFGWVQKELTRFWPLVDAKLSNGRQSSAPLFMTIETCHYLVELLMEKAAPGLEEVVSPPHRLAAQVMDNIDKSAVNGVPILEAARHLQGAFPGDEVRERNFSIIHKIISQFYHICLENRVFNYGMAVELYLYYLLEDHFYQDYVSGEFDYFLVDNLEETRPAAQYFIRWFMDKTKETLMAFTEDGGHARFFGADPDGARELMSLCRTYKIKESFTCTSNMLEWSGVLAENITGSLHSSISPGHSINTINAELRSEMISDTAREISRLVNEGISPYRIAVIAPHIDKVLEYALEMELRGENIGIVNFTRSKRLIDEPYAVVLITLAILAHPEWGLRLRKSDLHESMCHLLQLDPVRSSLLVSNCVSLKKPELLPLDDITRRRCGYYAGESYDKLIDWLNNYCQKDSLPVDAFLQKAFADLIVPLIPGTEQVNACRQILKSASRFCEFSKVAGDAILKLDNSETPLQIGKMFIDMVLKGTISAERLEGNEIPEDAVILATPYAFLLSQRDADYQFWLDVYSSGWFPGDAKELSNPHVFSRQWNGGTWSDGQDVLLKKYNCACTVRALARKIKKGLVLAASNYNTRGFEQEGPLLEHILNVSGGDRIGDQ